MEEYVILRRAKAAKNDLEYLGGATAKTATPPSGVSIERLTPAEYAQADADPDVLAARRMPTALIRPLAATQGQATSAWGIGAVKADVSARTGAGITVAVLDTGIEASHPAFAGVGDLVQKDFSGDGDGDQVGHGTHCAGTIFGRDVGGQRIGIARGVDRVRIGKVLRNDGSGSSEMLFAGIQWALSDRAQVISMSLGFDYPGLVARLIARGWPAELATSEALEAYRSNVRALDAMMLFNKASAGAAVMVAAAGNESRRDVSARYRVAKSLPAATLDMLSVAAASPAVPEHGIADFSNSLAEVAAPGVDILSAWIGGGLHTISGTSMACPHVAGVAALWWEDLAAGAGLTTAAAVIGRIGANARAKVFAPGFDRTDFGDGLVTAP